MAIMATITVSQDINAPIDRVFQIASNIPDAAETIGGITAIETLAEAAPADNNNGIVGKGYAWRETRVMMGKEATEDMTIIDWSPPNSYTVEARSHGSHYLTDISLEQTGDGSCRITMSFNATAESVMAKFMMIFCFLFKKMLIKCLTADLGDIKAKAESE